MTAGPAVGRSVGQWSGTALITGATAGLGAQFARQLAAQGMNLVLVARDAARLEAVAKELAERHGTSVEVLPADLTTDAGCGAVAHRLAAEPAVTVLVNNAGQGVSGRFGELALAEEEHMLDLNVRSVLRLCHAAVPAMRLRGTGRIINIASVAGLVPRGETVGYGASKAYVIAMSRALAALLAGSGVTVTAVCPGFVRTEFHQRAGIRREVPAALWLQPEPVVRTALADAARGKIVSVPDVRYKAIVAAARILPGGVTARLAARTGGRR